MCVHIWVHTHTPQSNTWEYYSSPKKELNVAICDTYRRSLESKWNKSDTKLILYDHFYVESKKNKWVNFSQSRNRRHRYREPTGGCQRRSWGEAKNKWANLSGTNLQNKWVMGMKRTVGNTVSNNAKSVWWQQQQKANM